MVAAGGGLKIKQDATGAMLSPERSKYRALRSDLSTDLTAEHYRMAVSLLEVVVALAVLLILAGLLLPGLQQARESCRRSDCQSKLRQTGTALLLFHDLHNVFPHGGWGHKWVGVPERGVGRRQPGGWIYCLLPFLGEAALHDLGAHERGERVNASYSIRLRTPLKLLVCPSRRECRVWPIADKYSYVRSPYPFGKVDFVARSDYAINAGTSHISTFRGPASLEQGDDPMFWANAPNPRRFNGISHLRISGSLRAVVDGISKTYLIGEKHVEPENYATGASPGDNESQYAGYCSDLHRFAGAIENLKVSLEPFAAPLNDHARPENNIPAAVRFGSAHPAGCNMLRCDGSLLFLAYDVDREVHFRAGQRNDSGRELNSKQ
jgi:Protein of unknown function (DUF1559)